MTPIPNYLSTYPLHYFYYSLFGEYDGAGGVEMRGLEGVWRGASRHQSLIIYRPYFTAQKAEKHAKQGEK